MQAILRPAMQAVTSVFVLALVALVGAINSARWLGNLVLPTSFYQLIVLRIRRGNYTRAERMQCWKLLRRARKGLMLSENEWNELRRYLSKGLLRTHEHRKYPYAVGPEAQLGKRIWHDEFSVQ
ncbi:MAG: hypothetical protein ABA06_03565 [Parcubacteria bacterium C7867-001]|nr:MAG: hypothetical protein ABA06_03565 [Parcubacteria bacterium C7867-001]